MDCKSCDKPASKVIYYGLPCWGCFAHESPIMWGFWMDHFLHLLPFNGLLTIYTGNYFRALLWWLFGDREDAP